MKYGYIYITTNKVNGKIYIGQRKGEYDENYFGSGRLIQQAINKYGKENFENRIIQWCDTKDELNDREAFWIRKYDCTAYNNQGYNIAKGGTGGDTISNMNSEQKSEFSRKISNALKGKNNFGNQKGENNPMYNNGHKISGEKNGRSQEYRFIFPDGNELTRETKDELLKSIQKVKAENFEITPRIIDSIISQTKKFGRYVANGHAKNRFKHLNGSRCYIVGTKITDVQKRNALANVPKLQFMLDKQKEFQSNLGYNFNEMDVREKTEYIKEMSLWTQNEINEMIHELPYAKHWSKKYDSWKESKINDQLQLAKEEAVDAMLFLINILVALGMSEEEIFNEYLKKNKINIDRQNNGY